MNICSIWSKLVREEKVRCEVCGEQISSSDVVHCYHSCNFFLHQVCAKRPREITHLMHPLRLTKRPAGYSCDSCRQLYDYGSAYNCRQCDFDLHILCALPSENEHIHHHPLTFQRRMASFVCNFCRVEDKDQSYLYYKCPF
ncbi:hypothetical protein LIER_30472 [Lithospermum erythrorhizon]|uniref:DC1 domain-containing protein n=1 Tax=Lithospermum erythrorhizon TaxID=34254 RepID=A0AAV3RNR9_LITER